MFYGLLTAISVVICQFGRRSGETLGAAYVLALIWLLSNLSHWFLTPYTQYFPFIDGFTASCMAWVWRREMTSWRITLILLFLVECLIHAEFFALGDFSRAANYLYTLKRNLLYISQLACVVAPNVLTMRGFRGSLPMR